MIAVIDFGSQFTHLISRRLRQIGVLSEIFEHDVDINTLKNKSIKGIILSGGPSSVYEKDSPKISDKILKLNKPVMGICYGWQLMAKLLGADVKNTKKEYGPEDIEIIKSCDLFNKITKKEFSVYVSHGDSVITLPKGFEKIATTKNVEYTAVQNSKKNLYGLQFHPEAKHTEYGLEMFYNFSIICGEKVKKTTLNPDKIIDDIKKEVGDNKVICAVSGGVDSSVAAYLIGKAIGKNLIPVYVESGLMRSGTRERVKHIFTKLIHADLVIVDARKRFLKSLKNITEPEKKRKIIGKLYVDIFNEEASKHKNVKYLAQGTIYSDVIESKGSKQASKIKSHHNVGGLPKDIKLKLLEPNRNYYKDEVREIGRLSGLPEDIVMQQPWPGPGHAVNIMGEVTEKRLRQVFKADEIVVEEMTKAGLYNQVFECFAIMTGAFSTAVKGDARVYAEVVAIRSYNSTDIMTADWTHIPYEILQKISSRIVNEVPDVSRVVYDITTKPPATMRWE